MRRRIRGACGRVVVGMAVSMRNGNRNRHDERNRGDCAWDYTFTQNEPTFTPKALDALGCVYTVKLCAWHRHCVNAGYVEGNWLRRAACGDQPKRCPYFGVQAKAGPSAFGYVSPSYLHVSVSRKRYRFACEARVVFFQTLALGSCSYSQLSKRDRIYAEISHRWPLIS